MWINIYIYIYIYIYLCLVEGKTPLGGAIKVVGEKHLEIHPGVSWNGGFLCHHGSILRCSQWMAWNPSIWWQSHLFSYIFQEPQNITVMSLIMSWDENSYHLRLYLIRIQSAALFFGPALHRIFQHRTSSPHLVTAWRPWDSWQKDPGTAGTGDVLCHRILRRWRSLR